MRIFVEHELNQYRKTMMIFYYRKAMFIVISIVGLAMLLLSILYFFGNHSLFEKPPVFQVLFGSLIVFGLPYLGHIVITKSFNDFKKTVYEIGADYLVIDNYENEIKIDWENIQKIEEKNNLILISVNNYVAYIIPKISIENIDKLKELLKKKSIPKLKLKK